MEYQFDETVPPFKDMEPPECPHCGAYMTPVINTADGTRWWQCLDVLWPREE